MDDRDFLKALIERGKTADEGYFHYAHIVACLLPKNLREQLKQLVNGPIWDGDVISKADRSELFQLGLAVRVCCKGEQGYTGAVYFAHTVLSHMEDIRVGKIAA